MRTKPFFSYGIHGSELRTVLENNSIQIYLVSIVEKKNNWFLHIVAYCGCLVKDGFKLYNCKTKSSSFFEMESFEKCKEQCEPKVVFIVCQGFI